MFFIDLRSSTLFIKWAVLLVFSSVITTVLIYFDIPAALLLGPMISAVVISITGITLHIPYKLFFCAQCILGCLIGHRLSLPVISELFSHAFVVFTVVVITLLFAFTLGAFLIKYSPLPGSTAIWGCSPGAASMMVIMSMDHDADPRLVAFMQYYRVLFVSALAIFISHTLLVKNNPPDIHQTLDWFSVVFTSDTLITLMVAVIVGYIGRKYRLPGSNFFASLIAVAALQGATAINVELPQWLYALAYIIIGFNIGLRFTRETLKIVIKVLPIITLSVVMLIIFCIGLAWFLMNMLHIDFFTAYLATSPGGMDAIAIISANAPVDISFVMAIQILRLLLTLVLSPVIAKFIAKRV